MDEECQSTRFTDVAMAMGVEDPDLQKDIQENLELIDDADWSGEDDSLDEDNYESADIFRFRESCHLQRESDSLGNHGI